MEKSANGTDEAAAGAVPLEDAKAEATAGSPPPGPTEGETQPPPEGQGEEPPPDGAPPADAPPPEGHPPPPSSPYLPDYAEEDRFAFDGDEVNHSEHEDDELGTGSVEGEIDIPDDIVGRGWFDPRINELKNEVNLDAQTFHASPRDYDNSPKDVPSDHPLRAIAKVFSESPPGTDICIKAYRLTDELAMDLILHYGVSRNIFIILDFVDLGDISKFEEKKKEFERGRLRYKPYPKDSISKLKMFLLKHEQRNSSSLFQRVEIRIADMTNPKCCQYVNSSMHENMILTEHHVIVGSYNLSTIARCKNWESIRVVQPVLKDKKNFMEHWEELGEDRELTKVYKEFFAFCDGPARKRMKSLDEAAA